MVGASAIPASKCDSGGRLARWSVPELVSVLIPLFGRHRGEQVLGWDDGLRRLSAKPCCVIQDPVEGTAPQLCTDERYVWEDETLMVIPPAGIPLANGELRWRPPFHWGGMLVRRDVFDAVGGYH